MRLVIIKTTKQDKQKSINNNQHLHSKLNVYFLKKKKLKNNKCKTVSNNT